MRSAEIVSRLVPYSAAVIVSNRRGTYSSIFKEIAPWCGRRDDRGRRWVKRLMTSAEHIWTSAGPTMKIELIYDLDCPHIEGARSQLRPALNEVQMNAKWQEWDVNDKTTPKAYRAYTVRPQSSLMGRT